MEQDEQPADLTSPPRRRSALPREARVRTQPNEHDGDTLAGTFGFSPMVEQNGSMTRAQEPKKRRKKSLFSILLGIIGEILITFGLIVGGFVVWQLWWTSVLANQVQSEQLDDFAKANGSAPSVVAEPVENEPPPFTLNPSHGQMFGVVHFPSFGKAATRTMAEGTTNWDILDHGGFGHYEGTAWPGQVGNFSLAAHRRGNGDALMFVEDFKPGDPIIVETADAFYVYRMTDHELVTPDKVRVVSPDPYKAREAEENGTQVTEAPSKRLITLTTCHPQYTSTHRWIVHGELDYSILRSEGMPKELLEMNAKEG
ncbi:class E sortase [Arcanobacterium phocisimile]|uniref:Class E sortase n=1 Tax=Arcanobacterium phocisimile TaxID=1302235 RepID=A0ABX7IGL4_9ACTO|nr:class E sortase [Arcanobacterium phocisimile]QRV02261.1 class E sortase [Arcanobacterium phocisimile]